MLSGLHGPIIGANIAPLRVEFTAYRDTGDDRSVYTFSDIPIGFPHAGRRVVVAIFGGWSATAAITGCKVDETAATEHCDVAYNNAAPTAGNWVSCGIYSLEYAEAVSLAEIEVTFDQTAGRAAIGVWSVYGRPHGIIDTDAAGTRDALTDYTVTLTTARAGAICMALGQGGGTAAGLSNFQVDGVIGGFNTPEPGFRDTYSSALGGDPFQNTVMGHAITDKLSTEVGTAYALIYSRASAFVAFG